ncbi:MAG: transposase [Planctomycetes bacterium]|nr:transposase [Planctomycetota bacterium]
MSSYLRHFVPGGTYFFTVVTERRTPVFIDDQSVALLGASLRSCKRSYPFTIIAMVTLPEHLHAIWSLPNNEANYSRRWSLIKSEFTRTWLAAGNQEQRQSTARNRERRRGVWQRRFWEHAIRDEVDLEAHFDYIHFNPVKHGLVSSVKDWPWSTFHRWVKDGHYLNDWGSNVRIPPLPGNAGE